MNTREKMYVRVQKHIRWRISNVPIGGCIMHYNLFSTNDIAIDVLTYLLFS